MLRVNAAWIEHCYDSWEVATELASELKIMAEWLSLASCGNPAGGDLAPALAASLMGRPVSRPEPLRGRWPTTRDALRHYDG